VVSRLHHTHKTLCIVLEPQKMSRKPSLLDIQAEQEREHHHQQQHQQNPRMRGNEGRDKRHGNVGGGFLRSEDDRFVGSRNYPRNMDRPMSKNSNNNGGGGGGGGRGGIRHTPENNRKNPKFMDRSHLPLEQGIICSLCDSFGFIHCADREDEIFFHYSNLMGDYHPDQLHIDDEVSFRVGPTQKRNAAKNYVESSDEEFVVEKLAAYDVQVLEKGTIVWVTQDEPGRRYRGRVEHIRRNERGSNSNNGTNLDGKIHILSEHEFGKLVAAAEVSVSSIGDERESEALSIPSNHHENTLVDFAINEYQLDRVDDRSIKRLGKGDLVDCIIVRDRRTKLYFADDVKLLVSERDRLRQEQEKRMLSNATVEHGVITSLKGDYGFLQSNKRREEIFFHYSNVDLDPQGQNGEGVADNLEGRDQEMVLREGQEMQFLVVNEEVKSGNRNSARLSARRVQMQPRGSVKFYETIARGVAGVVTSCPHHVDSGHALETKGKIQLLSPISVVDDLGETVEISDVFLAAKDSPGGSYDFRGGSLVGLWIEIGDTLLFDVVKDFVDGACHAKPTSHIVPLLHGEKLDGHPTLIESESTNAAVRLIKLSLAGRSEGVVSALKDGFGFIQCAERPVDAHFKLFQLLPDELQVDIRRNMGLANVDDKTNPLKLSQNCEVQFDLSLQGTLQSAGSHRSYRGGHKHQTSTQLSDRENLKAQRILLVPPGTVSLSCRLATGASGTVSLEDTKQPYAGAIDFDPPLNELPLEERHPLVAAMIEQYLAQDISVPLVFHDFQSKKEDDVVIAMIAAKGHGRLGWSYKSKTEGASNDGRLRILKIVPDQCESGTKQAESVSIIGDPETASLSPDSNQKLVTPKTIKRVRFNKSNIAHECREELPPALGDAVTCDVVVSRRTGQVSIENIRIIKRHDLQLSVTGESGMGVVKDVIVARKFGFISVFDSNSSKREILFFHFSNILPEDQSSLEVKKGDEVKFNVATEGNGKRVAVSVCQLPRGTIQSLLEKDACKGYILLEPSRTTAKTTVVRQAATKGNERVGHSRWDEVGATTVAATSPNELGSILLLEDPANQFQSSDSSGDLVNLDGSLLRYKFGAFAQHGIGTSPEIDASAHPKRGDLVTFMKTRKGSQARDIRVLHRGAASFIRGHLEQIKQTIDENGQVGGTAKLVTASREISYVVKLQEFISCDPKILKENDAVEGLLHEGKIYGLSRMVDIYLDSKLGSNQSQRPKLNLSAMKDRGGKVVAQSLIAKGPDGTKGFVAGWTSRSSKFSHIRNGADIHLNNDL
jgi:cold shock CspA family protein